MIFDCPRCDAENAVPASDIPAEGRVVQCIGCKQPFRVLPPEDDDDGPPAERGVGPHRRSEEARHGPVSTQVEPVAAVSPVKLGATSSPAGW